jgi:RNA polymerase sigma factor (sigma-70 family)
LKSLIKIRVKVLFSLYSGDIYRYAFSILNNKEDAEDIVQEVFRGFLENREQYRNECSVKTWLLILTRNRCFNFIKYRNKRQTLPLNKALNKTSVNLIEDDISIEMALNKLNAEENEIIFLREYMGYSYKEISDILNISVDNVKVRIFRVKKKLKELLYE